jgi:type VI secretion system secreted protein VgrG
MSSLFGPITIDSPLGPDGLVFRSMWASEALGQPFEFVIDVLSARNDLKPSDLIGLPVTVHLEVADLALRHWNGLVTRLEFLEIQGDMTHYRLNVAPWLWWLGLTAGCRIFQDSSVVDIVTGIFRENGMTDFESRLTQQYDRLEYVVQYRETALAFVSRLMEREGIYYFFRHEDGKHTLVLVDGISAHDETPGYASVPFHPPDDHRAASVEYVDHFYVADRAEPGTYTHADFDFQKPRARLYSTLPAPRDHAGASFEIYDYPGGFSTREAGDALARVRLEQIQRPFEMAFGSSNARGLTVGSLFTLTEHRRQDLNVEYLIVDAKSELRGHDLRSAGGEGDQSVFACTFHGLESSTPFRTAARTERPVVRGPQTATVVGKAGEEIWTDSYGRVKLQFHWDREGTADEKSSCWVRVSQLWAGDQWGAMHIPRIGQEVIVDFLEGDPDRPIVIGRVYNASKMPPYALPANQTQSGIKSRSTKGGTPSNFNEIRFEDRKGHEDLFLHAEKTQTTVVKGSQSISVGGDRSVGVGGNETYTVKKKRTTEITGDESLTVVDGDVRHDLHHDITVRVGDTSRSTIQNDYSVQSNAGQISLFRDTSQMTITQGESVLLGTANAYFELDPAGNIDAANTGKARVQLAAGGNILVDTPGGANITIQRGGTQIVVKDDTVTINSTGGVQIVGSKTVDVSVGSTKIALTSSEASVTVGGSKIDLTSSGATVTASMIKLNS